MKIKKETKHLDFYKKCMETGRVETDFSTGLCGAASGKQIDSDLLNLFEPTREERNELADEGISSGWWASGLPSESGKKYSSFTPLRQTIVLFMAAINNEL